MRMMMNVTIPHEPFNTLVREGKAGEVIGRILDQIRPEAVYFTEVEGRRGLVAIVDIPEPSKVPSYAEPFFMSFNAECKIRIVMGPEELQSAGLAEIGERWG